MIYASATASSRGGSPRRTHAFGPLDRPWGSRRSTRKPHHNAWLHPALWAAALLLALVLPACSSDSAAGTTEGGGSNGAGKENTILLTRKGDTSIQVTESEVSGNKIIKINTVVNGEEHTILLNIDEPNYEIEIPLSIDQVIPQTASAAARGPEGQFQDLLIAQYLERAQQSMVSGDYNGALREVNLVLNVQPNHIQAHTMKGSIYYAMGNYQLANDEWENVLAIDPSNTEVLEFQAFLKQRSGGSAPPLPSAETAASPSGGASTTGGSPNKTAGAKK